jgi:anti-sigma factor RsiW
MNKSAQTMTRYLLGELSDSEQAALEEKYFTDPEVFDKIVKAENELVDDYARGRLNPESREKFEQYYLAHPKRRERAEFAQTLVTKLDQFEADRSGAVALVREVPWWGRLQQSLSGWSRAFAFSMGLALLLLVLGLGALFFKTRRSQEELARTQAAHAAQEQRDRELQQQLANARTRINDSNDELNRARPQVTSSEPKAPAIHTAPAFVTLVLTAGGIRGTDTALAPEIIIPTGTEQVRIQLNLRESDYSNYSVALQALSGRTIFSRQGVKPKAAGSGSTFVIIVPARRFAAGDYILTLRGVRPDADVDDVSKSLFRVEKK